MTLLKDMTPDQLITEMLEDHYNDAIRDGKDNLVKHLHNALIAKGYKITPWESHRNNNWIQLSHPNQ